MHRLRSDIKPSSWVLVGGFAIIAASIMTYAGPLDPPAGPVAPSYKTLTDVEPRIAINASNTPGDASNVFRITAPGSYYLTQNIQLAAGKAGIGIAASDVTIDLNGFTITGASNSGQAIINFGSSGRITVRNGRMQAMAFTAIALGSDSLIEDMVINSTTSTLSSPGVISVGDRCTVRRCQVLNGGILITTGSNCTYEDITADNVAGGIFGAGKTDIAVRNCRITGSVGGSGSGISVGDRLTARGLRTDKFVFGVNCGQQSTIENGVCTNTTIGYFMGSLARVRDCTISTTSSAAIAVTDNAQVHGCSVTAAIGNGIDVGNDCIVTSCTVTGSSTVGISGLNRNTLVDCTSSKNISGSPGYSFIDGNSFTNCRADENAGDGFTGRFGNIWQNCSARSNVGDGVESSSGGTVTAGRFDGNGAGAGVGANIRITGDACRVEGNSLIGADFGIQTTSGGNTIHRNSSRNSANSYGGISGGNDVGPIGTSALATSPWANIQY